MNNAAKFTTIYQRHQKDIIQYAFYYCKDTELSKDISQDVFIKYWLDVERMEQLTDALSYLLRMIRNSYLDYFRRQQSQYTRFAELPQPRPAVNGFDAKYFEDLYHKSIQQLPAMQKEIFFMIREKSWPHKKIATILSIPRTRVVNTYQATLLNLESHVNWQQGSNFGFQADPGLL